MPKLFDIRTTKIIVLPSFADSTVEIYDSILVGNLSDIDYKENNQIKMTLDLLPKFIKSWNFTDENDKPLEINKENLGFLRQEDLKFLIDEIVEFNKTSKKK
jgi:hypothetical protein